VRDLPRSGSLSAGFRGFCAWDSRRGESQAAGQTACRGYPRQTLVKPVIAGLVVAAALVAGGCAGSGGDRAATPKPKPAPSSRFAYDASRPLAVRDAGRVNSNYPIAVRDVSYASGGRRIEAFLAVPPGGGRRPAAVYLHGSGGDRRQLLVPAVWLAGRGAVTLAITAPSAQAPVMSGLSADAALRRQRDLALADVLAVRRGFDLLRARRDVDGSRLAYVGWSAGARTGALLAGVERRVKAFALMSGGATPVAEYAASAPASLRDDVRRVLGEVDPLRTIRHARAGSLLLQDGRRDAIVPRAALDALVQAAPRGTDVRWYPAGHELDKAAYRDQLAWLARRLEIDGPPVRGAVTGP
jgi:dienelactone hydrolase